MLQDGGPSTSRQMEQPRAIHNSVQSFRLCTYCGLNLEKNSQSENLTKKNMKAHIALHHAQQICIDKGLGFDTEEGVDQADFFVQLHFVNRVLASIEAHNYPIMPACHFFRAMNREVLHCDASEEEKTQCYMEFLEEARAAFRKYRVLYLQGISVPSSYRDLLPVPKTTYKDVCWKGLHPPRSNKFSAADFLSAADKTGFDSEVNVCVADIVKAYSM